jgi:hypothetical protein
LLNGFINGEAQRATVGDLVARRGGNVVGASGYGVI